MSYLSYEINKGVNRPIEFRGLKAQYIYYLAIGLAVLLVLFSIIYIAGVPVYLCMPVIGLSGAGLFMGVYRYSHKYGEHGLMKAIAFRQVPSAILSTSVRVFRELNNQGEKVSRDDSDHGYSRTRPGCSTTAK
jgi:hypothetical protein